MWREGKKFCEKIFFGGIFLCGAEVFGNFEDFSVNIFVDLFEVID